MLKTLVAAGYDHVGLKVAPGPWIDAVDDSDRLEYLFGLIDAAISDCLSAGLGVILDMHDSYYVKNTPTELLADGAEGALFQKRVTVTRLFAERYADKPKSKLMFGLFNEPPPASDISGDWSGYLWALYQVARTAMPNHTIMCSTPNYSGIDELIAFDPAPYGSNVRWAIHPYLPAIFAHQGYPNGYNNWVGGVLSWPPDAADKDAAIAAMTANVNADDSLTSGEKTSTIASQTTELGYYFDVPEDGDWIDGQLSDATDWATENGVKLAANEMGCTRSNDDFRATDSASRAVYIPMMTAKLAALGIPYTVFALDAPDYGITDGTGSAIGKLLDVI